MPLSLHCTLLTKVETHFEPEEAKDAEGAVVNDVVEDESPPPSYDFYSRFWAFQEYFAQPNILVDKLDEFGETLQV